MLHQFNKSNHAASCDDGLGLAEITLRSKLIKVHDGQQPLHYLARPTTCRT